MTLIRVIHTKIKKLRIKKADHNLEIPGYFIIVLLKIILVKSGKLLNPTIFPIKRHICFIYQEIMHGVPPSTYSTSVLSGIQDYKSAERERERVEDNL